MLVAGWGARGAAATRLRAALDLALDFHAWRTLARRAGLDEAGAVEVLAGTVRAAAGRG